jgi:hypothetical protein
MILVLPAIILIVALNEDVPGPKITNSYSLNEKLHFLEKRKGLQADILAIGSSITLNNTHSGVIVKRLKTDSYLNTGAWGLRIPNIYSMTKSLLHEFNPKKVILTTNVVDFYPQEINIEMDEVKAYLTEGSPVKYQIRYFEANYFFRRLYTNMVNFNSRKIYMSLNFDKFGAVLLQKKGFEINEKRWVKKILFEPITPESYLYLDSLSLLLAANDVELIYVQTPVREGMINAEYSANIKKHIKKVHTILDKYPNSYVVDGTAEVWNDSLFVDSQHLNSKGAEVFSEYWLTKYLEAK